MHLSGVCLNPFSPMGKTLSKIAKQWGYSIFFAIRDKLNYFLKVQAINA